MAKSNCNAKGGGIIQIDEGMVKGHLDKIAKGTVEETLNELLEADAERLVKRQAFFPFGDNYNSLNGFGENSVYLLYFSIFGRIYTVARNIELQNYAVMHDPVNGRSCHHGIFEYFFPL